MSESVFPLNIEDKVDHPDKLAKLEGVPSKYYDSAYEINRKRLAIEENRKDIQNIKDSSSIYSFDSEADVTAKWSELNSLVPPETPKDGTTYIRSDLKQYGVWDSTVAAKGVTLNLKVPEQHEVRIQDFYVQVAGKTDLLNFEVNDKFRGWLGTRKVEGVVIAALTGTFLSHLNDRINNNNRDFIALTENSIAN